MSKPRLSPLLQSSLEMMLHAIEHLKKGTERDMGFAVLHADNSIELLLKELARSKGIRVMDTRGYSLEYYKCVDKLIEVGLKIPELPDIDLLHTERNNIYHLGNKPDKGKAEWLVYDVALGLVQRMCKDELNYGIDAFSKEFRLSEETMQDIELTRNQMVNQYLNDASVALNAGLFEGTIIMSYVGIEALLREYVSTKSMGFRMIETVREKKVFPQKLFNKFETLRRIRNVVAHGMGRTDENEAKFALEVFKEVIDEIGLPLDVKCKTCEMKFNSGIVMSRKAFKTAILKANKHQCPKGHVHSYDKEDYIAKL